MTPHFLTILTGRNPVFRPRTSFGRKRAAANCRAELAPGARIPIEIIGDALSRCAMVV